MSFELLINLAKQNDLVYQVYDYEVYFVPIGKNYFTRVRNLGTDYYIEYCDDYRKPLNDKVIVVRFHNDAPVSQEQVIMNHILQHPKNKEIYRHFDECMKILDKQFDCNVVDNEAFILKYNDESRRVTKLIAQKDRILVEYYNYKYVSLNKSTFVMNEDNYNKMVKYLIETINSHPYT